jgi:ElaA protein
VSTVAPVKAGQAARVIDWKFAHFDDLTVRELHDLLQVRAAVFVVEQKCAFQDVDGADPACWHLVGREHGAVVAYCRLVPPGLKYPEPSIGRVITTMDARRTGSGRALMQEAIARAEALWPGQKLRIGAQMYLERFYGDYGFVRSSDPYDEDGILHIEMLRESR